MKNIIPNSSSKKNRAVAVVLIVILALLMAGAIVAAFFSDLLADSGNVATGTLDIDGTFTYFLNGVETSLNNITSLAPGDVIVVTGDISNNGNQCAWIREKIALETAEQALLSYVEIYYGNYAQSEFATGTHPTAQKLLLNDGAAVSANKVIDGTSSVATELSQGDYNYINDTEYSFAITIYFSKFATNSSQGKNLKLSVAVQALQFKNNNSVQPEEEAWIDVEAIQL